MDIEKEKVWADYYLEGDYPYEGRTQTGIVVCSLCLAVIMDQHDYWERHVEWHKKIQGEDSLKRDQEELQPPSPQAS